MPTRPPARALFPLLLLLALAARPAPAGEPPAPDPDRVAYATPKRYLALAPRVGDPKVIEGLARQLARPDPAATLRAIWLWTHKNLRLRPAEPATWRSVGEMLRTGTRTGDAEGALALGVLARAAGIPCVWVKTVDLAWLRAGAAPKAVRGHVFLEVYLAGAWRLLDPGALTLYDDYDPKRRALPGGQYVFDKGGDPFALVLPNRAALYRAQVARHFRDFDRRRLPWGRARDLLAPVKVYVAGAPPVSRYVQATCEALGFLVAGTLTEQDFERAWPDVRGKILVVTTRGGRPVLPAARRKGLLPAGYEAATAATPLTRRHASGTTVVFVRATGYAEVEVAVAKALSALRGG